MPYTYGSERPDTRMKPMNLQTTIAGSLPKPAWLAPPRQLWAPWLLQGEALTEGKLPLSREVAAAKLDALAAGAAIVRREIEHEGAES